MSLVLPTRLIVACNEMPSFYETTGALSSRLLLLKYNKSFAGREDYGLKARLRGELPGICNWALRGLARLRSNGRFTMPETTQRAVNEFKRTNSPTLAFIQDCLRVENRLNPGNLSGVELTDDPLSAKKGTIQTVYRDWCEEQGLDLSAWNWFWKRMKTCLPALEDKGRGDQKTYYGIGLKKTAPSVAS